jgi:hypothetical protein
MKPSNIPCVSQNRQTWVEGHEWLATDQLQPGHRLHLSDGRYATVHAAGLVRRTQHAHIGFAADDRANAGSGAGIVLDLSEGQIKQASEALALSLGPLELGDAYLTTVYNFEVQEFHTYYVGDIGVWVHNSDGCTPEVATRAAISKTDYLNACFSGDTHVHIKPVHIKGKSSIEMVDIRLIGVGDKVLSRCEITGEVAYKKVLQVFKHNAPHSFT